MQQANLRGRRGRERGEEKDNGRKGNIQQQRNYYGVSQLLFFILFA